MKTYLTCTLALVLGAAGAAVSAQDAPATTAPAAAQGSANGVGNNTASAAERVPATSPQASEEAQSQVPESTAKAVDALGSAPGQTSAATSEPAATGACKADADDSAKATAASGDSKAKKARHRK
jgi:hypothetical protein